MRIISGTLKGKSIYFIRNFHTRPLKDSVRENIFNILKHSNLINISIQKANILDLYSGVGSFGIECISRGAEKVTFVENDKNAINILEKNLINLSIIKNANLFHDTVENFFKKNRREKYDIFFFDPPFIDKNFLLNLHYIKKNNMFKKNHILIIHREKKSKDDFDHLIEFIKTRNYGRSKIIFGLFK